MLDQSSLTITRNTTAQMVEGWDSLAHVTLMMAVEQEFGIRFALAELESMKNVGDMVDLISAKRSA